MMTLNKFIWINLNKVASLYCGISNESTLHIQEMHLVISMCADVPTPLGQKPNSMYLGQNFFDYQWYQNNNLS